MKWNAKYMLSVSNIFFAASYNPSFSNKKSIYMCIYLFFLGNMCIYIYEIINISKIKQYEFIHLIFFLYFKYYSFI